MDGALLAAYITAGGLITGGAFTVARAVEVTKNCVTKDQLRAALAEFKFDLINTLNGTYMRTPLVEGHLRNIHEKLTENRDDLRDLARELHAH